MNHLVVYPRRLALGLLALLAVLLLIGLSGRSVAAHPAAQGHDLVGRALPTGTPTADTAAPPATATPTPCTTTLLNEGFESGTLGAFSSAVTTCVPGGCGWNSVTTSAHSGTRSAFAPGVSNVSDQRLELTTSLNIPTAGGTLTFWHRYGFGQNDGGVLEASTNGGVTWTDAGAQITSGGYTGTVDPQSTSPLFGRQAWTNDSTGSSFRQVTVNLAAYAGQILRFRFREGTNFQNASTGWYVDDVVVTVPVSCATATATPVPPTATPTFTPMPPTLTRTATSTAMPTLTPGCVGSQTLTGSILSTDPTHRDYVNGQGGASTCAAPKACPGSGGSTDSFHYDLYYIANVTGSPQCFTIQINGSACNSNGVQVNLYKTSFDPNNLCTNYLGDTGASPVNGQGLMSVTVPANTNLVIEVEEFTSTTGCANYTLTVTRPTCGTPTATSTPGTGSTATVTATNTAVPVVTGTVTAQATLTATPVATETPCTISFSDVTDPAAYYYAGVYYLACHGVISGYSDGTFRPFNNTTRAQMTKIVTLAFNLTPATPPASGTFADVDPRNVFYGLIETAVARGIVTGYSCGGSNPQTGTAEPCDSSNRPYFRPSNYVTRGQLAKIVVIGAGWALLTPPTPTFTDVTTDNVFYSYIETAVCHGVISGYNDSTFRPNAFAFRGQIAKIVYLAVTNPQATCAGLKPKR